MILIIGGAFQGKRKFAQQLVKNEETKEADILWCDGSSEDWETFCQSFYCFHLPDMTARRMKEEGFLGAEAFVRRLLEKNPQKVIVGEEIGSGIIPMNLFERKWREETGRIYCLLAEKASQVWRVTGGIGQRIK